MQPASVLIADAFSPKHLELIKSLGYNVAYQPKLTPEEFSKTVEQMSPEIIIVRSRKVNKTHIDSNKKLRAVLRAGAGVDNIDIKAATAREVTVCNTPGRNSVAVAELVFALILALDRNLFLNHQSLQNGVWNKAELSKSGGLKVCLQGTNNRDCRLWKYWKRSRKTRNWLRNERDF